MSKRTVIALLIIALVAIVLIFTSGSTTVNLGVGKVHMHTPLALLLFTSIGVVIGLLLK
ncbi:MAG: hypothetical protein AB7T27_00895 [Kiritimatiellia bacterium]